MNLCIYVAVYSNLDRGSVLISECCNFQVYTTGCLGQQTVLGQFGTTKCIPFIEVSSF